MSKLLASCHINVVHLPRWDRNIRPYTFCSHKGNAKTIQPSVSFPKKKKDSLKLLLDWQKHNKSYYFNLENAAKLPNLRFKPLELERLACWCFQQPWSQPRHCVLVCRAYMDEFSFVKAFILVYYTTTIKSTDKNDWFENTAKSGLFSIRLISHLVNSKNVWWKRIKIYVFSNENASVY